MTEQPLQGEVIVAAIDQVFAGKGMTERANACPLNAAAQIVFCDSAPQAVF